MAKITRSKNDMSSINENILYLTENDANALGIFEDSIQRVYVDDREVDVVFVDEHEIIPATDEERKLYNDAERLARKYASMKFDDDVNFASSGFKAEKQKRHWWEKFKIGRKQNDLDETSYENYDSESTYESSRALKPIKRRDYEDAKSERARLREEILAEREALRKENERLSSAHKNSNRTNKFTVRSDVFTEEELEVLQGIISKSKDSNKNTKKTKNSKVKTIKRK